MDDPKTTRAIAEIAEIMHEAEGRYLRRLAEGASIRHIAAAKGEARGLGRALELLTGERLRAPESSALARVHSSPE